MTVDDGYLKAADNLAPIVTQKTFETIYKNSKNPSHAGATWEMLEDLPDSPAKDGSPRGRVWTDQSIRKFAEQAKLFKERNWARLSSEYNDGERVKWLEEFDKKMAQLHYDPLGKFEADWWEARKDVSFNEYFAHHFDEDDPNDPTQHHCPGLVYCSEVKHATTPAPFTPEVCSNYAEELNADITESSAVLLRSFGANQATVLPAIKGVLAVDMAVKHAHENRNDKLYDLGMGVVKGDIDIKVLAKYSWLNTSLGDIFGGYTLAISQSLSGAVTASSVRFGLAFASSAAGQELLARLQGMQLVQRATDLALESIVSGKALKTPMEITKRYLIGEAMALFSQRGGFARKQILRARQQGHVDVTLITDNHEMSSIGDMDKAVAQGSGTVELRSRPIPALLKKPRALQTLQLSDDTYSRLYRERVALSSKAAYAVQTSFSSTRAVIGSLEGRLALGVILINGVSLLGCLEKLDSKDAAEVRNAWIGMIDSTASVLGGITLVWETAAKASIAGRLGKGAVERSVGIHVLRASGYALGAVAGVANAVGQWAKLGDAAKSSQYDVAILYGLSGAAFIGTAGTSTLAAAGAFAERQAAKGVAGVMMRRIAVRYGASGTAALMGVSVSGWGLILLGAAVLFEVGAVILTPSELQKWVQRSYFGYGKGNEKKFSDWESERAALEMVFTAPVSKADAKPMPKSGTSSTETRAIA